MKKGHLGQKPPDATKGSLLPECLWPSGAGQNRPPQPPAGEPGLQDSTEGAGGRQAPCQDSGISCNSTEKNQNYQYEKESCVMKTFILSPQK